jgi:hypothetical protein
VDTDAGKLSISFSADRLIRKEYKSPFVIFRHARQGIGQSNRPTGTALKNLRDVHDLSPENSHRTPSHDQYTRSKPIFMVQPSEC